MQNIFAVWRHEAALRAMKQSPDRLHFYEARLTAYEAQLTLHEAALRAMKQSPDRLHVFLPVEGIKLCSN